MHKNLIMSTLTNDNNSRIALNARNKSKVLDAKRSKPKMRHTLAEKKRLTRKIFSAL